MSCLIGDWVTSEGEMGLPELQLRILVKLDLLMVCQVAGSLVSLGEERLFADRVSDRKMSFLDFLGDFLVFLRFINGHITVSKVRMRVRLLGELYSGV